jgi:hypothetical protein
VTREQLDDQTLHPWRASGSPSLHDNVALLSHLVPCTVEDWQAPDA